MAANAAGKDGAGDEMETLNVTSLKNAVAMRSGKRLATEALPLFPTAPTGRLFRTVVFDDRKAEVARPIWIEPLNRGTISALLASREVHEADGSAMVRPCIAQVFRARRVTKGKNRNFSPTRYLL
jgi:hypothetical protein